MTPPWARKCRTRCGLSLNREQSLNIGYLVHRVGHRHLAHGRVRVGDVRDGASPQGNRHPPRAWGHGETDSGDVQLPLREDCAGLLRHRRAHQRVRDASLLGGLRLPRAAARLGVRGGIGRGAVRYHSGGHLTQFESGYGESGEVFEDGVEIFRVLIQQPLHPADDPSVQVAKGFVFFRMTQTEGLERGAQFAQRTLVIGVKDTDDSG